MANGQQTDPLFAFRFKVEIDSLIEAGFSECAGLQVETEVEEIQEGGVNELVHRLPKGSKYTNLTLKHGIPTSDVLWQWHKDVVQGKVKRKMVNVLLLDNQGQEQWRWTFKNAYPVKWIGPDLKADNSAIALETLELVHDGFDVKVKQA